MELERYHRPPGAAGEQEEIRESESLAMLVALRGKPQFSAHPSVREKHEFSAQLRRQATDV